VIKDVILPKLGQTMEEGTIVEWFKKEGDTVGRGDALFAVESDKAVLEVEATGRGVLRRILVPAGEKVPVLTVVALITSSADEPLEGYARPQPAEHDQTATAAEGPVSETEPEGSGVSGAAKGRVFVSPRARKTARERGVDLTFVQGTGPAGRIVEGDVLAYLAAVPRATPTALKVAEKLGVDLTAVEGSGAGGCITRADVEAAVVGEPATGVRKAGAVENVASYVPLTGVRGIIAERMAASAHTTARVTLVSEVDATELVAARERLKETVAEEWGFVPGYNDLLGLIVSRALRESPYMNARLGANGQTIEQLADVNVGMAVDTERGLLVPVVRYADRLGLRAFGEHLRELVDRARQGRSLPEDLSGGTFTITNLGMYEIDAFTPIINLPEAAILGVGRIRPQAVPQAGRIVGRQMMTLSLSFDHRLVDGAPAARFLQQIKELVEAPHAFLA
jgi:pyruvate dehydrogenase E2 component (dihydrolipoamide acetyltransferase)